MDVVFHVAGPLLDTEFTGTDRPVRAAGTRGRYARPLRLVAVQIAVPADLENRPPEEVLPMLADHLVEATELAAATLAKRKNALPVRLAVDVARTARRWPAPDGGLPTDQVHRARGRTRWARSTAGGCWSPASRPQ
ncbi:hypothetical protein [Actinoplanes sp. GCM10030250]|uniref:hypothetical protein n=1 Tax=Actinoplanes sp. GCM10030250 TaxID=3273376 RepID=UPI0036217571